MGHKVHPLGFRLGVIRDWQSKWYADKHYVEFLHEDLKLRQAIQSKYAEAGISQVEITRQANEVTITIHTARPGVVIGRGGQRVDEMRHYLEDLIGKKIQLNIQEIPQPQLDAYLVARTVAEQIERRIAYRRAIRQAVFRTMQSGAKGVRISCAGRLGGAEIARRETMHQGQVPLHTLRADIDYGFTEARTNMGRVGVKVWIYTGDILPELKAVEVEEREAEEKPVELVANVSPEVKPSAKEEKREVEEKPVELVASISPEVKPPAKRKRGKAEEKPSEPAASVSPEVKPPAKRKRGKAEEKPSEPAASVSPEVESPVMEEEKEDVTAQEGEISQGS